jgi:hypothetical protein
MSLEDDIRPGNLFVPLPLMRGELGAFVFAFSSKRFVAPSSLFISSSLSSPSGDAIVPASPFEAFKEDRAESDCNHIDARGALLLVPRSPSARVRVLIYPPFSGKEDDFIRDFSLSSSLLLLLLLDEVKVVVFFRTT